MPVLSLLLTQYFGFIGTGDVDTCFLPWVEKTTKFGILTAYKTDGGFAQYPPLITLIPSLITKFGLNTLISWKLTLTIFLIISCLITKILFQSWKITYLLLVMQTIPSIILGYADIMIIPFMLLSFNQMKKNHYVLAGILFSCGCLFKWQPIIFLPGLIVYFLIKRDRKKIIDFGGGLLLPAIVTLIFFGWYSPTKSIWLSLLNHYFSGYGCNLIYLISFVLSKYFSSNLQGLGFWAGGLNDLGQLSPLKGKPKSEIFIYFKTLFLSIYIFLSLKLSGITRNTFENGIRIALISGLIYMQLSPGVHENHHFILLPLFLYLIAIESKFYLSTIFYFLLVSVNIYMTFGIDGKGKYSIVRNLYGLDLTLLISLFTFVQSIYLIFRMIQDMRIKEHSFTTKGKN